MSTRAVYTFHEKGEKPCHVYKHYDGYPAGACEAIADAIKLAWPLPRFEADEFAAAFVAANKVSSGSVRLSPVGPRAYGDLAYHYKVTLKNDALWIEAREAYNAKPFFRGTLSEFTLHCGHLRG